MTNMNLIEMEVWQAKSRELLRGLRPLVNEDVMSEYAYDTLAKIIAWELDGAYMKGRMDRMDEEVKQLKEKWNL